METVRKVAAVIIGIIILVLIVLAAFWLGGKIRERFLTPKPVATVTIPKTITPEKNVSLLTEPQNTATAAAIPKTGPEEIGYLVMGLTFLSGVSSLVLAHKRS